MYVYTIKKYIMNKITPIIREDNPERYATLVGKHFIMLQIEDDLHTCSVVKTIAYTKRAKTSCKTLWEGDIEDFYIEYKGEIDYGQIDIELAFRNYIKTII